MAKKVSIKQTQSDDNPPTAPVLGPASSRKVPQLISSTKSTKVVPVAPEEPEPWFSDEADSMDDGLVPSAELPVPAREDVVAEQAPAVDSSDAANQYSSHVADQTYRPHWEQTQAVQPAPQPKQGKKKRHPFLKLLIVLILLAAATYGAYWFGNHAAEQNSPAPVQATQPAPSTAQQTAISSKHYDSANYSFNFDYPSNWTLTDTASALTVVSPAMRLAGTDGMAQAAHVVLSVQPMQTSISGYPSNGATAELASTNLTYKRPSSAQRSATSLSYLGYGTTNGLNAIFITGDAGYQQGQSVPESDITKADPLVSVEFLTCTDDTCGSDNSTPLTLQASTWQSLPVAKTIGDMLASIQFE